MLSVVRPAAQGGSSSSSSCVKSKTVKTVESPDSSPSSFKNALKPLSALKASLPPPLKASLPAPLSVALMPGPGPSSAPTLLNAQSLASTLQEHTTTGDRVVELRFHLTSDHSNSFGWIFCLFQVKFFGFVNYKG